MASERESRELDTIACDMGQQVNDQPGKEAARTEGRSAAAEEDTNKPLYGVTDVPPWYLCIILAFQHYLTAFGAIVAIPLILSEGLCLQHDRLTQGSLINSIFFVSGLCTLLQVTFGIRLPILQGGTFAVVTPTVAILSTPEWKCPAWTQNASLVNTSSPEFKDVWTTRLTALQGSIMVASVFQILLGFSGLIGFLMRFIGPLTIAPTIALIGLSLYDAAGAKAGTHWGIATMTSVLIILFSQYLKRIAVPIPAYSSTKKLHTSKLYIFQMMPILLGILVSWFICYILTISDVLPSNPSQYGYLARTDVSNAIRDASWFTVPYPGQWGVPTVNLAAVLGLTAGIMCSILESVGDYYACARLSGAPPPPSHAISRGIGVEGLGSLIAGAFGTGNGTTSFSENVAALGITKVASRAVILLSGVFMVLMGMLGKFGAIFTTIPAPVIGGMFLVMFGVIGAAGISNLQATDMHSSRNIFVFGFSMFSALVIPNWIQKNPQFLNTGVKEVDQVLHVLLTTNMFIGGFFGFLLDNTAPGTKRERGLFAWSKVDPEDSNTLESEEVYDLPFGITAFLSSYSWVRYIPFCPWRGHSSQHKSEDSIL
ncbi:solute carrier family 23 member 1-like isoform X2 [Echeneis naucrates]|nr:solute carrier family 23 member 1-like isoform X2 [Echeneis naucrates]XP_029351831.1 solute carrier family 23 member 1-like isoform X2 [Echeneis naucrates]XP_029351832.1 solute carrier family 23 member 1-like isoform X2 [Echeneis naucrates]XP_029351833.1 solute carrier family 23 member 1-like isoform X2 [Echeneis naucrates]XP_029351834.1 solute carrier family 23 member 1-like isoform X2 [Echeneis naucrates]